MDWVLAFMFLVAILFSITGDSSGALLLAEFAKAFAVLAVAYAIKEKK